MAVDRRPSRVRDVDDVGPRCVICGGEARHYCGKCDEWFCDRCVTNWPMRAVYAGMKLLNKMLKGGGE